MAKTKREKIKILEKLSEKISRANSLVFIGHTGLKAKEQENLRKLLKNDEGELYIIKKKLLNLALSKFKFEKLEELKLEKEMGIVLGYDDEMTSIKIVFNFSREHENLKIKSGIFEKKFLTSEEIKFLAILPSKEILRSQIVSLIKNPLTRLVNVLQGNLKNLVYILDILSQKT